MTESTILRVFLSIDHPFGNIIIYINTSLLKGLETISIIFSISASVNSPALLLGSRPAFNVTILANLLPIPLILLKA
jgi:hypothetical protein